MADHELTAYGDKELWYVTGSINEGDWSLPIYIYRYSCDGRQFVRIAPILPLPPQSQKLKELFSDCSIWNQNGQYMVEAPVFEQKAHKAPGVTPDCYRKWPGVESKVPAALQVQVQASDEPEPQDDAARFLDYVHKQTGVSRKLLKLAWWSMAETAPQWLFAEHRPIDLGYAVLHPVPYRVDWKEILLKQDPAIAQDFKLPPGEREQALQRQGFMARLATGDLMAIDAITHRVHWTLECIPTKTLEQRCEQIEITQIRFGVTRYIERYEKILANLLPTIVSIFGAWLPKMALPFAKIRAGTRAGSRRMVPTRPEKREYERPRGLPTRIKKPLPWQKNLPQIIPAQVANRLPPVPPLLPGDDGVWDCQEGWDRPDGNMDKSTNGPT